MLYIVGFLLICGLFFFAVGSVGVVRLPDFYSRLHSAGMMDSMGLLLCMTGLALLALTLGHFSGASLLTALKIMLIVVFVYITSPTATHAIVDAGVRAGLKPWTRESLDHSKAAGVKVTEVKGGEMELTSKKMESN